jgi:Zn-dependent peptidase ImmA (M78 family)/transcriptional regulator with XRE-family HTH domain
MEPDITVRRVREAIAKTGLSQAAFAERAGLDSPKLSKSLASVRRFTSLDLANIAELAEVTVDWLLGKERPTPAVAARAATMSSTERAIDAATKYAEARANLRLVGFARPTPPDIKVPHRGRLIDQGAELAAEALQHVPDYVNRPAEVDLADLIEETFGIDVVVRDLSCDGLAWGEPTARLILAATSKVPTRQRFSLAHELGHILANDHQDLHVDKDVMDPTDRREPSEMRANAFAAAFLMPETTVRSAVSDCQNGLDEDCFSSMVMRFAVSPSALAYRLSNLGLIDPIQRTGFATLTTTRCAQVAGQIATYIDWADRSAQERRPLAMLSQMLEAYLTHKTTLRPLADLVDVSVEQLRQGMSPADDVEQDGPAFAP